jgi:4-amino-4-deoxy-L-arabinose transferase-like glycosyltransferase
MPGGNARSTRTVLLLIVGLAITLRLAFALGYWTDQPLTRDEREYLSLARGLAAGHGFVYDDVAREGGIEPFGRAPGYPAFLALVGGGREVTPHVPSIVKIAQSLAGGAGVWMVFLFARRLAGDRAGLAAAAGAACYPPLVWIAAYAFSEAIFWPLGLGAGWLLDRAHQAPRGRDRTRLALVAGICAGLAVLIRPSMLFFLLLAGPWWLWQRRWAPLAALALGSLLVIGPWTVRNVAEHGRFVLVASEGGVTFWTGNHPLAIGDGDMAANPAIKLDNQALRARYPDVHEEALEPVYYREAFAWMRAHPVDWFVLQLRKVFYLIVPIGPSYTLHSPLYFWASVLSYGLLLPCAVLGAWRLGRRRHATPGLWLLAASAVAVCLVFFPQERFRIPVIDPVLLILAGTLVAGVWQTRPAAEGRVAA